MTNEQKAKEIAEYLNQPNGSNSLLECHQAAMAMAKWKEQQMIKYLYKNIQSLLKDYGVSEASADITTQLFLANFKKAMKGE